jgi:hypothetical protein
LFIGSTKKGKLEEPGITKDLKGNVQESAQPTHEALGERASSMYLSILSFG